MVLHISLLNLNFKQKKIRAIKKKEWKKNFIKYC